VNRWQLILSTVFVLALILATNASVAASPHHRATVHMVQAGEHLTAIANQYGTTPQGIASASNLANMNLLYVGQRVVEVLCEE
jgi:LysM repeat protein